MPTSKSRKKKPPKRVLALRDLGHAKTAVLNSLSSAVANGPTNTRFASSWPGTVPSRGLASIAQWCSDTGSTSNSRATWRPCDGRHADWLWPAPRRVAGAAP